MMEPDWKSFALRPELLDKLEREGIAQPTPVQTQAVPALLGGSDVYARSQTGTGKTLAFLLPLLDRIEPDSGEVQALVLAPTQELAMQLVRVAEAYGEPCGVRVQQLIGGAAIQRQIDRLKRKPQLVIGTPGRVHELAKLRKLKLHAVRTVVVDEADQMFELGSTKELEQVLRSTGDRRQVAFFSATLPPEMERLAGRWMKAPVRIDIAPEQRVAGSIAHYFVVCEERQKFETARRLLHALAPASALLFLNDTDQIANWESKLAFEGFRAASLYGDANKLKRSQTLDRFRDGRCSLLLATDVAARGLDIEGLPLVVNLDAPADADRYVHRAGRTGRMGRAGTVVTLVAPRELWQMDKLRKRLGIALEERRLFGGKLVAPGEDGGPRRQPGGQRESARSAGEPARARSGPGRGAAETARVEAARSASARPGRWDAPPHERRAAARADKPAAHAPAGPGGRTARTGAGAPRKRSAASLKAEQERLRKDKGAPRWLKAKRQNGGQPEPPKS